MEVINYGGNSLESKKQLVPYNQNSNNLTKPVDYLSVKSAFQALVITKTLECHELISQYLQISNPLLKMTIAFGLFNPYQACGIVQFGVVKSLSIGIYLKRVGTAFIYRRPTPVKKTFEINYICDNTINHLYIAFDWYLKSNSKTKKNENHTLLILNKPVEPNKKEKDYPVLKTVPEEQETEFTYDSYTFSYSKTSFDDVIYCPSGEMKKKNYKLLIWNYDCTQQIFDNLTQHVLNLYAKSKVDEVWTQKMYTHENMMWKESLLERNKRKISSVVMKNNRNTEISEMLTHFNDSEAWHLERGVPYKKSFLFYGPPGTGKSSMIRAMSNELQRHIHYINLSLIKNDQELMSLMGKINFKETIVIIEDIDSQGSFVHKRNIEPIDEKVDNKIDNKELKELKELQELKENKELKENRSQITLSGLLNQIDGVMNNHGMILIMTTNYPERLDEALIRDGRVDERICFNYTDYDQIHQMFKNFYNDCAITIDTIKSTIDLTKYNVAPCNVENSLRRYYNNADKALIDIAESMVNKKTFESFKI